MATKPISGLPAAGSASGPDLLAIVQGGVTKKSTVTQVLDALGGATAVGAITLADLFAVNQGGTTKKATPQQIFDAIALLAGAAAPGLANGDSFALTQSGVAKKLTFLQLLTDVISGIPTATGSVRGLMAAADKTILDGATSSYSPGSLAKYSGLGGLQPNGIQLANSTSGVVIRKMAFKPLSATLVGGGTNETFDRDITSYGFSATPNVGLFWSWFAGTYAIHGGFVGWSTTNMRFNVRRYDGGVLSAGTFSCDCLIAQTENAPV